MALAMSRPKTNAVLPGSLATPSGPRFGDGLGEAVRGVLAKVLDYRRKKGLLRREVPVDAPFGHAGGGGDLAHSYGRVPFWLGEQPDGRFDQALLGLAAVSRGSQVAAPSLP